MTAIPGRHGTAMGIAALVLAGVVLAGAAVALLRHDAAAVELPPEGGLPDYQLGGAYEPDPRVDIVGRDRGDPPESGIYSICYVNGFQTQPGELDEWPEDLLLDYRGAPLADPAWPDEILLDTSSAGKRERISQLVGEWIEGCARDGFDAVEFDNLDSYARSHGELRLEDNLALAREYVRIAHSAGLAAAQKNTAEASRELRTDAGFDFAVTESCAALGECEEYAAVYGDAVVDIEYADIEYADIEYIEDGAGSFRRACSEPDAPQSMVLRDRGLLLPGDEDYVFELCRPSGS